MICDFCGNTHFKEGRCPLCGHTTNVCDKEEALTSSKSLTYGKHFVYPIGRSESRSQEHRAEEAKESPDSRQIPKSLRYEVLARDNWTCQYCGRRAPEVVLEVDHRVSWRDGGKTVKENLVTSCRDCNRGKSSRSVPP